jgi:4-aminobutyrate aminotransferase-like enzyme
LAGTFIFEPVQGYGGIFPFDNGYLKNACKIIQDHKGVIISDEIQTGFGRLGEVYWGFQLPEV